MSASLALDVLIGLATGAVAGLVFFGGLRWTLDRLPDARRPVLLAVTSLLLRAAALAGLLVLTIDGSIVRIAVALVAIIGIRTAMISRARAEIEDEEPSWS